MDALKQQFEALANDPRVAKLANLRDPDLHWVALVIVLCPLVWNVVARLEYYFKTLAKPCFGESGARYAACYLMTAWILFFSTYRDIIFHRLIQQQPKAEALTRPELAYVGYALVGVGQVFVWSSFLKLGITGTFLGDYCGILMSQRVTGFPFNVLDNPMYVGSSLSFMGTSLLSASAVGLALSAEIFLCYHVAAAYFEGPFTTAIYSRAAAAAAKKKK